ncbi:MAG: hypothetical protein U5K75_09315 [Ahrensia sp.]|nr:hypothetical protein [Ahrensia sp.]
MLRRINPVAGLTENVVFNQVLLGHPQSTIIQSFKHARRIGGARHDQQNYLSLVLKVGNPSPEKRTILSFSGSGAMTFARCGFSHLVRLLQELVRIPSLNKSFADLPVYNQAAEDLAESAEFKVRFGHSSKTAGLDGRPETVNQFCQIGMLGVFSAPALRPRSVLLWRGAAVRR